MTIILTGHRDFRVEMAEIDHVGAEPGAPYQREGRTNTVPALALVGWIGHSDCERRAFPRFRRIAVPVTGHGALPFVDKDRAANKTGDNQPYSR